MDDVVEKVAERRHRAPGRDGVVVRPEDPDEALIARERLSHPGQDVRVDEHVRVDEQDDVGVRLREARGCAPLPGLPREAS